MTVFGGHSLDKTRTSKHARRQAHTYRNMYTHIQKHVHTHTETCTHTLPPMSKSERKTFFVVLTKNADYQLCPCVLLDPKTPGGGGWGRGEEVDGLGGGGEELREEGITPILNKKTNKKYFKNTSICVHFLKTGCTVVKRCNYQIWSDCFSVWLFCPLHPLLYPAVEKASQLG